VDGGGLEDDHPGPAAGARLVVGDEVVRRQVLGDEVGLVRGRDDPVGQRDRADRERREQALEAAHAPPQSKTRPDDRAPSRMNGWPEANAASSDASHAASPAISSGSQIRPSGCLDASSARAAAGSGWWSYDPSAGLARPANALPCSGSELTRPRSDGSPRVDAEVAESGS
jgi:hypothetical protein